MNYDRFMFVQPFFFFFYPFYMSSIYTSEAASLSLPLKITERENNNSDTALVLILTAGHGLLAAPGHLLSRAVK